MNLAVIGKFAGIALAAAIVSWLTVVTLAMTGAIPSEGFIRLDRNQSAYFPIALIGSYGVGFPIAVLVYFLSGKALVGNPAAMVTLTLLVCVMLILASFALGDGEGALILGFPSVVAAIVYAVLGWIWIIRPTEIEKE